jgi:hypothetical protein
MKEKKPNPILRDKDQIKYYYDTILPQLAKYTHASRAEWVELLSEQCIAEQNCNSAITDFLTYVQQEWLDIELDPRTVEKEVDKLFKLRFLRKMINAMGLGLFEEDIIREEIVKLFRVGNKGEAPLVKGKKNA